MGVACLPALLEILVMHLGVSGSIPLPRRRLILDSVFGRLCLHVGLASLASYLEATHAQKGEAWCWDCHEHGVHVSDIASIA